eukprot:4555672-Lingulodinium_polyedra.AAC.1
MPVETVDSCTQCEFWQRLLFMVRLAVHNNPASKISAYGTICLLPVLTSDAESDDASANSLNRRLGENSAWGKRRFS